MTRTPELFGKIFASIIGAYCSYSRSPSKLQTHDNSKNHRSSLCALLLLFTGCSKKTSTTKVINSKQVKIGFIGLTCEAPIYTAYEKGFFKDEGLEPELVKCSWAAYKDNLALGSYDITHHLVMYFLKPIEQGLDVRFLGGVHTGCLRVQTGVNSPIQKSKT